MQVVLINLLITALVIAGLASSFESRAEAEQLPKGLIIERVVSKSDPQQSYALFLPTHYTPDKKWPILYCFDPLGRGSLPVKLFQDAAEKYGYIVAGSHNSKNGPLEPALAAMKAMWADTHAGFTIDERRVYVAGFSGGARVASLFASLCQGCISGVIGNGAGLHPRVSPSASLRFAFFGTVGDEDFNYPELMELDAQLSKYALPHRIVTFKGEHRWAPEELHLEAVEWLEIQAMRTGARPRDENLIHQILKKRIEKAHAFETRHELYQAYISYQALVADFHSLTDVSEPEKAAARLRSAQEVGAFIKREKDEIEKQHSLVKEILALAVGLSDNDRRTTTRQELRRHLAELKRKSEMAEDTGERRVARRTRNQVFAHLIEAGTLDHAKDYRLAVEDLELAAEVKPDNAWAFYSLASVHALHGEKRKALDALQKAVEKGFNDPAQIESNKELDSLRGESRYQSILRSIGGK